MKRAEILRKIDEIEERIKHRNPDWAGRMAAWEKQVAGDQPTWKIVRPEVEEESTGGEKNYLMEDGSFLVQGYAPTKHTVDDVGEDRPVADHGVSPRAAQRPEPAAGGARPIDQGDGRTDRVSRRGGAGRRPNGKTVHVKFARATADVNPPETPLDPIFDDKSGKKRVTGPVGFAIDGKDETAWGIDVGPGRRNQPRKAVFTAEKPIAFPGGTILTFHLDAEPRRLEQRRQPELQPRPVPAGDHEHAGASRRPGSRERPRDPGHPARASGSAAQAAAVFSYWRTTVPGVERKPTPGSRRSGSSTPRARRSSCSRSDTSGGRRTCLQRGDFLKPGRPVEPGVPAFLNPLPAGEPARPG